MIYVNMEDYVGIHTQSYAGTGREMEVEDMTGAHSITRNHA